MTAELEQKVDCVREFAVCDAIECGNDGALYLTALKANAIKRLTSAGSLGRVVQEALLKSPDDIAINDNHVLLFTTSQIQQGSGTHSPYYVFRFQP